MTVEPPALESDHGPDPEQSTQIDREIENRAAVLAAVGLWRDRDIPEDILELQWAITDHMMIHESDPTTPAYRFDRFEALDSKVGGMGLVIEACDRRLGRKVAIKLWIKPGPEAQAALRTEAQTLAQLEHVNVVRVYDLGEWKDRVFIVMEWVEGCDGHEWLSTPRRWQDVIEVFTAAGAGLVAAHEAGIQHRDVKPANILIGHDGRVLVADFGVADPIRADANELTDSCAGTPFYMAPERLRGRRGDGRSDQFSFCVALWQALHDERPFAGETRDELLEAIDAGAIMPAELSADVPHALSRVVRKGLAADPDQRYASMSELLQALRDARGADDQPLDELLESSHVGRPANPRAFVALRWFVVMLVGGVGGMALDRALGSDRATPHALDGFSSETETTIQLVGGPSDVPQREAEPSASLVDAATSEAERARLVKRYDAWLASTGGAVVAGTDTQDQSLAIAWAFYNDAVKLEETDPTSALAAAEYAVKISTSVEISREASSMDATAASSLRRLAAPMVDRLNPQSKHSTVPSIVE